MKRLALIPVLVSILAISACNSRVDDSPVCGPTTATAPANEVADLQAWLASQNISAQADNRGFFYTIRQAGDSTRPTICSDVQVNYSGKLTSGSEFDAGSQRRFSLRGLIAGWQAGIPLIGEGGTITLYLPPSLAYGATATPKIPANSILIFDIDLLRVD